MDIKVVKAIIALLVTVVAAGMGGYLGYLVGLELLANCTLVQTKDLMGAYIGCPLFGAGMLGGFFCMVFGLNNW